MTTSCPSCPLGFENTKSVRNAVPLKAVDPFGLVSVPSIGAPSPGMVTPPPETGVGEGVAPGALLDEPPDGATDSGGVLGLPPPPPPAPLLEAGPIVGMPADARAPLMSAFRLSSGGGTASEAALWIEGLSRNSHASTSRTSRTISASSALRNHGGRMDSWSIVPSRLIGRPPSGVTNSWNGRVFGWPRQNRFVGLTLTLANPAIPGSTTTDGGLTSNFSRRSASVASTTALRRVLPRLSTARSCDPEPDPRDVRGTSSAWGSEKA